MWFDSLADLGRILILGTAAYATLVVALRVAGKRSLTQLNAFDLVVTVALGSVLATILLSTDVSWTEGALALALLLALQFAVAFVQSRSSKMHRAIAAQPTLLAERGRLRDDALKRHRIAPSDVLAAVRGSGAGGLSEIAAVVLEANGSMSVIRVENLGDGSTLPFPEFEPKDGSDQ